jgi:putative DNA primase/helicase
MDDAIAAKAIVDRLLSSETVGNGITVLIDTGSITMEEIVWLWKDYLARGKFHVLGGAPDAGKTTLGLAFVSTISAGDYWPDVSRAPQGNCLIWTSEDGIADTIKPRLVRMGADLSRVKIVKAQRLPDGKERPFSPATDMPELTAAVRNIQDGVAFLMIDPVVAAIGAKTNSHNNAETRNSLQPVIDFAEETNCAVLGITHFTKGTAGRDPTERITGSLAFGAVARIVMVAARKQSGAEGPPRVLTRAKNNIGLSGGGFGYDIDAAPLPENPNIVATRIVWLDPLDGTARTARRGRSRRQSGRAENGASRALFRCCTGQGRTAAAGS